MNTGYKIKEVADRSGFTTATLRYYEGLGLLPEAARTPAGYRLYDDGTLERLAFIARAKQLGCSLDEIADLTLVWETGRCGPVQDRLRTVVADKLATARRQITELITFTADLQQAAATLERHRPPGACDDGCGCVSDGAAMSNDITAQPVALISKPVASSENVAIACTLDAGSMSGRLDDWNALLVHAKHRENIVDGVRVTFAASVPLNELIRLTTAEQGCCQFLCFSITVDTRGIALETRAAQEAQPMIQALVGAST